jgi:hypothetical protein
MQLTDEQQAVIDDVRTGQHVCVTALPGSGKSRVAYELIRQCVHDVQVVMLMYNRSLCDSTTEHVQRMDCPGRTIKAYTFHGLASALTGRTCQNDRQLMQLLAADTDETEAPVWPLRDMTLLLVDECQDLRPVFVQLVFYVLRRCTRLPDLRIVLLGDPRQLLYSFYNHNRADARFLVFGHRLFHTVNARAWSQRQLTRSFRSTRAVACFLNALIAEHDMRPGSTDTTGPPVILDVCNIRSQEPSSKILHLVANYDPSDVLILCSTLGPSSPARAVVRTLVRHGLQVHVQRSGTLRDDCTTGSTGSTGPTGPTGPGPGRIQCKTFCAAKGLEAKLVIVLNDRSLVHALDNSVYVALSRSMRQLVVFQDRATTSMTELTQLCAALTSADLTVLTNRYSRCPADTRPTVPQNERGPPTRYVVETMFQYMDPSVLAPLERLVQTTTMSADWDDLADYAKLLDVPTRHGYSLNVRHVLTASLCLAAEYARTRTLPSTITVLRRSRDPRVVRLVARGTALLAMRLPFVAAPLDVQHLVMQLPAFVMFATALDATTSFDEKLVALEDSDFGWIVQPAIVTRFLHLLTELTRYVPDHRTAFHVNRKWVGGCVCPVPVPVPVWGTPLLASGVCVYVVVNKAETEPEDVLSAAMYLGIHDVEYGYVSNVYTGVVTLVYVPRSQQAQFIHQAVARCTSSEADLDDEAFVHQHTFPLRPPRLS